jgi:hypothetical protein
MKVLCTIALTALLLSCYESPGVHESAEIIQVSIADKTGLVADGVTLVTVTATVDGWTGDDALVTFKTSDGVLDFSASGEAARSLTRNGPRTSGDRVRKEIPVLMRVGRTPGEVIISAKIGDFLAEERLPLAPALPEILAIDTSKTSLRVDGSDRSTLNVSLLRNSGIVSLGTRVAARVCCVDANGEVSDCPKREPLHVPALTTLEDGSSVSINVSAESLAQAELDALAAPVAVVLLRTTDAFPHDSACAPLRAADVGASIRFDLAAKGD